MWVIPIVILIVAIVFWLWIEKRLRDPKGVAAKIIFTTIFLAGLSSAGYVLFLPTS